MADALGHDPDDWVRARIADVTVAGAENDALALALDPLGPLDLLYRPVGDVTLVGDDDVRGVRTRHLRATLDLTGARAAPAASFEARPGGGGRRRPAGGRLARRRRRGPAAASSPSTRRGR